MAKFTYNPLPAWYFTTCLHNRPQESALFSSILFHLQWPTEPAMAQAALDQIFLLDQWKVMYALPQVLRAVIDERADSGAVPGSVAEQYRQFLGRIELPEIAHLLIEVLQGRADESLFERSLPRSSGSDSMIGDAVYFDLSDYAGETLWLVLLEFVAELEQVDWLLPHFNQEDSPIRNLLDKAADGKLGRLAFILFVRLAMQFNFDLDEQDLIRLIDEQAKCIWLEPDLLDLSLQIKYRNADMRGLTLAFQQEKPDPGELTNKNLMKRLGLTKDLPEKAPILAAAFVRTSLAAIVVERLIKATTQQVTVEDVASKAPGQLKFNWPVLDFEEPNSPFFLLWVKKRKRISNQKTWFQISYNQQNDPTRLISLLGLAITVAPLFLDKRTATDPALLRLLIHSADVVGFFQYWLTQGYSETLYKRAASQNGKRIAADTARAMVYLAHDILWPIGKGEHPGCDPRIFKEHLDNELQTARFNRSLPEIFVKGITPTVYMDWIRDAIVAAENPGYKSGRWLPLLEDIYRITLDYPEYQKDYDIQMQAMVAQSEGGGMQSVHDFSWHEQVNIDIDNFSERIIWLNHRADAAFWYFSDRWEKEILPKLRERAEDEKKWYLLPQIRIARAVQGLRSIARSGDDSLDGSEKTDAILFFTLEIREFIAQVHLPADISRFARRNLLDLLSNPCLADDETTQAAIAQVILEFGSIRDLKQLMDYFFPVDAVNADDLNGRAFGSTRQFLLDALTSNFTTQSDGSLHLLSAFPRLSLVVKEKKDFLLRTLETTFLRIRSNPLSADLAVHLRRLDDVLLKNYLDQLNIPVDPFNRSTYIRKSLSPGEFRPLVAAFSHKSDRYFVLGEIPLPPRENQSLGLLHRIQRNSATSYSFQFVRAADSQILTHTPSPKEKKQFFEHYGYYFLPEPDGRNEVDKPWPAYTKINTKKVFLENIFDPREWRKFFGDLYFRYPTEKGIYNHIASEWFTDFLPFHQPEHNKIAGTVYAWVDDQNVWHPLKRSFTELLLWADDLQGFILAFLQETDRDDWCFSAGPGVLFCIEKEKLELPAREALEQAIAGEKNDALGLLVAFRVRENEDGIVRLALVEQPFQSDQHPNLQVPFDDRNLRLRKYFDETGDNAYFEARRSAQMNYQLELPQWNTSVLVDARGLKGEQDLFTFLYWKDRSFYNEIFGQEVKSEDAVIRSREDFELLLDPKRKVLEINKIVAEASDGQFWCETSIGVHIKVAPESISLTPLTRTEVSLDYAELLPVKRPAIIEFIDPPYPDSQPISAELLPGNTLIRRGVVVSVLPVQREVLLLEAYGQELCKIRVADKGVRIRVGDIISVQKGNFYHTWRQFKGVALWRLDDQPGSKAETPDKAWPIGEDYHGNAVLWTTSQSDTVARRENNDTWMKAVQDATWLSSPGKWWFAAGTERKMGYDGGRPIYRLPLMHFNQTLYAYSPFDGRKAAVLESSSIEIKRMWTDVEGTPYFKISRRAVMETYRSSPRIASVSRANDSTAGSKTNAKRKLHDPVPRWKDNFSEYWQDGQMLRNIPCSYLGSIDGEHLIEMQIAVPRYEDPATWEFAENWTKRMTLSPSEFIARLEGAYERKNEALTALFVDQMGRFQASLRQVIPLANSVTRFVQEVLELQHSGLEVELKHRSLCFLGYPPEINAAKGLSDKTIARFELGYGQIVELPSADIFWLDNTAPDKTLDKAEFFFFGDIIKAAKFIQRESRWIMELRSWEVQVSQRSRIFDNSRYYNMVCHLRIEPTTGAVIEVVGMNLGGFEQRNAVMRHYSRSANQPVLHPDDLAALRKRLQGKDKPVIIPATLDKERYQQTQGRDFVLRHRRLSFRKDSHNPGEALDPADHIPYTVFMQVDPKVPPEDWIRLNDVGLPLCPLSELEEDTGTDLKKPWVFRRYFSANEDTLSTILDDRERLAELRGSWFWVRLRQMEHTGKSLAYLIDKRKIDRQKFNWIASRSVATLLNLLRSRPEYPQMATFIGLDDHGSDPYLYAEIFPGIFVSLPYSRLSKHAQALVRHNLFYGDRVLLRLYDNEFIDIQIAMKGDMNFVPDRDKRYVTLLPKDNLITAVSSKKPLPKANLLHTLLQSKSSQLGFTVGGLPNIEPRLDRLVDKDAFWEWLCKSYPEKTALIQRQGSQFSVSFITDPGVAMAGSLQLRRHDGADPALLLEVRFHSGKVERIPWELCSFADADRDFLEERILKEKWQLHDNLSVRILPVGKEKNEFRGKIEHIRSLDCESGPLFFLRDQDMLTLRYLPRELIVLGLPSRGLFYSLRRKRDDMADYAVARSSQDGLWIEICPGRIVLLPVGCLTLDEKLRLPIEDFYLSAFQTGDLLRLQLVRGRWGQEKIRLVTWQPSGRQVLSSYNRSSSVLPAESLPHGGTRLGGGTFSMSLPASMPAGATESGVAGFDEQNNLVLPHDPNSEPQFGQTVWLTHNEAGELVLAGYEGWQPRLDGKQEAWQHDMLSYYFDDSNTQRVNQQLHQLINLLGGGIPMTVSGRDSNYNVVYLSRQNQSDRREFEAVRQAKSAPILPLGIWDKEYVLARIGSELCSPRASELVKGMSKQGEVTQQAIIRALSKWVVKKQEWLLIRFWAEESDRGRGLRLKFSSGSVDEENDRRNIAVTFLTAVYPEIEVDMQDNLPVGALFRSVSSRAIYYVSCQECLLIEKNHPSHHWFFQAAFLSQQAYGQTYRLWYNHKQDLASLRESRAARNEMNSLRIGGKTSVQVLKYGSLDAKTGFRYAVISAGTGLCMEAMEYGVKSPGVLINEPAVAQIIAISPESGTVKLLIGETLHPIDLAPAGTFDAGHEQVQVLLHKNTTEHIPAYDKLTKQEIDLLEGLKTYWSVRNTLIPIVQLEHFAKVALDWDMKYRDRPVLLDFSVTAALFLLRNFNWNRDPIRFLKDLHLRALRSIHVELLQNLLSEDNDTVLPEFGSFEKRWQRMKTEVLGYSSIDYSSQNEPIYDDWAEAEALDAARSTEDIFGTTQVEQILLTQQQYEQMLDFCRTLRMVGPKDKAQVKNAVCSLEASLGMAQFLQDINPEKNQSQNGKMFLLDLIQKTRPVLFLDNNQELSKGLRYQLVRDLEDILKILAEHPIIYYTMPVTY